LSDTAALRPYHATIEPAWIDYNGHLRDAYYGLILSFATDDMMDQVGLDAGYRARTQCTLYTLEVHIHYLHEVKSDDRLEVRTSVLDCDRKRIHVAGLIREARIADGLHDQLLTSGRSRDYRVAGKKVGEDLVRETDLAVLADRLFNGKPHIVFGGHASHLIGRTGLMRHDLKANTRRCRQVE